MLNIYPQRYKSKREYYNSNDKYYQRNIREIENILKSNQSSVLIAGWGNLIGKKKHLTEALKEIYLFIVS